MALILDTCGLLSLAGLVRKRLTRKTLAAIRSADTVYVSACSLFEIAIKHKKHALDLGAYDNALLLWNTTIRHYDLTESPVTSELFYASVTLPDRHSDPFDRIIIAQAKTMKIPVITFDGIFMEYGISVSQ